MDWLKKPRCVITLLLLGAAGFFTLDIIRGTEHREVYAFDLAELDHVKHDLLNANRWARIGTLLAAKKIDQFQITQKRRQDLLPLIESSLKDLVSEIRRAVADMPWAKRKLASWVLEKHLDSKQLPSVAKKILRKIESKLRDPKTRNQLKGLIATELRVLEQGTANQIDETRLTDVLKRHGCKSRLPCRSVISDKITVVSKELKYRGITVIACIVLVFMVVLTDRRPYGVFHTSTLLTSCMALWLGGILTPMLAVEAKIAELSFQIAGEPIAFKEQLIFYQSKSIVDFVWTLVQTGAFEMVIVGVLIGLFSVVFPAAKMTASVVYLYDYKGMRSNGVLKFFALKSGKWSMADVMVVAIFMAYIGFSRMIDTQLAQIGQGNPNVDVLATDGTSFLIGFFLFFAFCIASLVFSTVIEKMQPPVTDDPLGDADSP